MRSAFWALIAAAVHATTLEDVCTSSYVESSLPSDGFYPGITIDPSSVVATPVTNAEVSDNAFFPNAVFDYCNVTLAYSHNGRDDQVLVAYWLPTPDNFQNRYLSTGGGGYAINSGSGSLPGGIIYGAVAGTTDGGFGGFDINSDAAFLLENGTVYWQSLFMFGYEAIRELSALGKELTRKFFNMSSDTKLYSYYQGCSEGGREGWSQIQRFGEEWDGAITGAPAFRFSFQQVQHLWSNVVEQTLDYYPPPCELEKILNETIIACDPLDGKTDGVVARSDLCKLHFDLDTTIGKPYYCAATTGTSLAKAKRQFPGSSTTPVQNGTVTANGVAVAKEIIDGLHDLQGRRVYLSYQPAASFADAQTQYNPAADSWELSISGLGGEFVARYLDLVNSSTLPNLDGITYDTLKGWAIEGWKRYQDTLETTWPDLTPFHAAGGKVLHFHGEADNSIPTASSVRYWESVRKIMYPNLSFNESASALNDWYRLFLVPGAAHCAPNEAQPNGPFPQTNLAVLIDWVEKGIVPTTLNATVLRGVHIGENQQICAWPLRPLWTNNGTAMECQYDQASIDTWLYDFNAIKLPVY
jgi:tannase